MAKAAAGSKGKKDDASIALSSIRQPTLPSYLNDPLDEEFISKKSIKATGGLRRMESNMSVGTSITQVSTSSRAVLLQRGPAPPIPDPIPPSSAYPMTNHPHSAYPPASDQGSIYNGSDYGGGPSTAVHPYAATSQERPITPQQHHYGYAPAPDTSPYGYGHPHSTDAPGGYGQGYPGGDPQAGYGGRGYAGSEAGEYGGNQGYAHSDAGGDRHGAGASSEYEHHQGQYPPGSTAPYGVEATPGPYHPQSQQRQQPSSSSHYQVDTTSVHPANRYADYNDYATDTGSNYSGFPPGRTFGQPPPRPSSPSYSMSSGYSGRGHGGRFAIGPTETGEERYVEPTENLSYSNNLTATTTTNPPYAAPLAASPYAPARGAGPAPSTSGVSPAQVRQYPQAPQGNARRYGGENGYY